MIIMGNKVKKKKRKGNSGDRAAAFDWELRESGEQAGNAIAHGWVRFGI